MAVPFLGEIRMFGFSRTPSGWQACDGTLLAISQNDALFALLGTTYGGDGQTTFAVPDLRGRAPLNAGSGPGLSPYVQGQSGGAESVALTVAQLPSHTHAYRAGTATATAATPGASLQLGTLRDDSMYSTAAGAPVMLSPSSTTVSGGSQPHDNTMPTLTVQFCIAMQGIFPSQG
ncbi:MAG: phage tail protein [Lysobacter sp.]